MNIVRSEDVCLSIPNETYLKLMEHSKESPIDTVVSVLEEPLLVAIVDLYGIKPLVAELRSDGDIVEVHLGQEIFERINITEKWLNESESSSVSEYISRIIHNYMNIMKNIEKDGKKMLENAKRSIVREKRKLKTRICLKLDTSTYFFLKMYAENSNQSVIGTVVDLALDTKLRGDSFEKSKDLLNPIALILMVDDLDIETLNNLTGEYKISRISRLVSNIVNNAFYVV